MSTKKFLKFFSVAEALSALSKDRSTKVGAVALGEDYEILSTGYNGFPRGVNDDVESRHERPTKYFSRPTRKKTSSPRQHATESACVAPPCWSPRYSPAPPARA